LTHVISACNIPDRKEVIAYGKEEKESGQEESHQEESHQKSQEKSQEKKEVVEKNAAAWAAVGSLTPKTRHIKTFGNEPCRTAGSAVTKSRHGTLQATSACKDGRS